MVDDPIAPDDFVASVGRLAISWATLELTLDLTAYIVFHSYNGSSLEGVLPRSLERKIRFLRDGFRKLAPLSSQCESAIRLLVATAQASVFRHDILHGFSVHSLAAGASDVAMARLLREAAGFKPKQFTVSAEHINQEAVTVMRLAKEGVALVDSILPRI
jgi:hypothetical protein